MEDSDQRGKEICEEENEADRATVDANENRRPGDGRGGEEGQIWPGAAKQPRLQRDGSTGPADNRQLRSAFYRTGTRALAVAVLNR